MKWVKEDEHGPYLGETGSISAASIVESEPDFASRTTTLRPQKTKPQLQVPGKLLRSEHFQWDLGRGLGRSVPCLVQGGNF
jgi:hypothetical protein